MRRTTAPPPDDRASAVATGASPSPEVWIPPPAVLGKRSYARAMTNLGAPDLPRVSRNDPRTPERRKREFAAGRRCAAQALLDAGAQEISVGVSSNRAPLWPVGFVGSIAHSSVFVWAAVARQTDLRSLGIDSEPVFDDEALSEAGAVALDASEWALIGDGRRAELATLIFSAKESLYKCLSPCTGVFFDFADAQILSLNSGGEDRGSFVLVLRRALAADFPRGLRCEGRYAIERGHVHTAVELAR